MLAKRGEADISLVARGVHLTSMQHNGLTLKIDTESFTVHPTVSDNPAKLGQQDYVILTIKAHGLAEIAESVRPLVGPNTAFVFAQNGLPWWYFYKHGGVYDGRRLESVDPGGHTWNSFGAERCIGSVVWQAADIDSPGVIQHRYGDRMSLGEPDGRSSARIQALSQVLTAAGIKCPVRTNLRNEIWLKLWVNLIFNPISVLTRQTLEEIVRDHGTFAIIQNMMAEAQMIAESLGIKFSISADERIEMAAKVGAHRTSMLQDVEAKRKTELDVLLGSVIEFSALTGIAAPTCKMIYDLTRSRITARKRG